jgi:hypothetical protein
LTLVRIRILDPAFDFDADTDSAFNSDADPDPAFHSDTDPDPQHWQGFVMPDD